MVNDLLDRGWIGERGDVAYLIQLICGNFAQDSSHDLATAGPVSYTHLTLPTN